MSSDPPTAVQPPAEPAIVITGGATATETAAVVAVLAALGPVDGDPHGGGGAGSMGTRRSLWNSRARAARPRLAPGPGAWRGSALPR